MHAAATLPAPQFVIPGTTFATKAAIAFCDRLADLLRKYGASAHDAGSRTREKGGAHPEPQTAAAAHLSGPLHEVLRAKAKLEEQLPAYLEHQVPPQGAIVHGQFIKMVRQRINSDTLIRLETIEQFIAQGDLHNAGLWAMDAAHLPLKIFREESERRVR